MGSAFPVLPSLSTYFYPDCRPILRSRCQNSEKPPVAILRPIRPTGNVYREDLEIHAASRKAHPERTHDLLGQHRAISEEIVNDD